MRLELSPDELLSTTRSVRKRLDLERTVEPEIVLECLDLALQAPTGSNRQGWHWMFITDPDTKAALAELYRVNFIAYRDSGARPTYDDADTRAQRQTAVTDSANHLADHFAEVPMMMIPLIEGRLDNLPAFAAASTWGSLLPAVWSFMLALRSRGMGSAWTTLHLPSEREAADILGIPYDRYTQGGLFPIAYTIGTEFRPAARIPTDQIVHWNRW
ncbi:MAG: nitroreductase family protein [Acidobacteria bacterium]|nr:nitroreductase family protein [Acidobacteriota bacterium]